jgi:hypothetical protein
VRYAVTYFWTVVSSELPVRHLGRENIAIGTAGLCGDKYFPEPLGKRTAHVNSLSERRYWLLQTPPLSCAAVVILRPEPPVPAVLVGLESRKQAILIGLPLPSPLAMVEVLPPRPVTPLDEGW